ncbi:MAG: GGDEF domain-containing protein [gamma proteobacterium symbiont of Phacoides pectinatus]
MVYLDLDGFKEVNDSHGHDVGDQLLLHLGERMQQVLRTTDTIARLGGDEFVAVLIDLGPEDDGSLMLGRLLECVARPLWLDGLELRVSASIGVSFFPRTRRWTPNGCCVRPIRRCIAPSSPERTGSVSMSPVATARCAGGSRIWGGCARPWTRVNSNFSTSPRSTCAAAR